MSKDLIERLRPLGQGFDKEPFALYKLRVASELTNFPECALENWIYRHYFQINKYSFLDIEKMVFNDELWSKEDIFNNI
ncbi:hypothetical protein D3C76_323670 [compost metagenome]